ncbi:MAG: AI-2E family transporter [Vampirovibrionales bacterium]
MASSKAPTASLLPAVSPRFLLWSNLVLLAVLTLIGLFVQVFQWLYDECMMLLFVGIFSALILAWTYPLEALLGIVFGPQQSQVWTRWLVRHISPRYRALLSYFVVCGLLWTLLVQWLPPTVVELKQLASVLPKAADVLKLALEPFNSLGFSLNVDTLHWVARFKHQVFSQVATFSQTNLKPLVYLLLGQIVTFYILVDGLRLKQFVRSLLPGRSFQFWPQLARIYPVVMVRTLRAYSVISLSSAAMFWGLGLGLHIPHLPILTLWFGLASFIPVLGPWLGLVLPLLTLMAYGRLDACVYCMIGVVLMGYVRTKWIGPRLFKRGYRLHPLILLILLEVALFLGKGWQGLLVFVPLTVLVSCIKHLFERRSPVTLLKQASLANRMTPTSSEPLAR